MHSRHLTRGTWHWGEEGVSCSTFHCTTLSAPRRGTWHWALGQPSTHQRAASATATARPGPAHSVVVVSIHQSRVGHRDGRTRKSSKPSQLRGPRRARAILDHSHGHFQNPRRGKKPENQPKHVECERAPDPPSPPPHSRRGPRKPTCQRADANLMNAVAVRAAAGRLPRHCRVPIGPKAVRPARVDTQKRRPRG